MRTAEVPDLTIDDDFPAVLRDHVWHTTLPRLYESILRSGSVLPNPDITDSDRWKTSRGPEYYAYVRVLGGVSLFDFRHFQPAQYSERYPMSSWREFVPYRRSHGVAIWMQIDVDKLGSAFMNADALRQSQERDKAHRHTLMPVIEAAHIGPLPLTAVTRTFRVGSEAPAWVELQAVGEGPHNNELKLTKPAAS